MKKNSQKSEKTELRPQLLGAFCALGGLLAAVALQSRHKQEEPASPSPKHRPHRADPIPAQLIVGAFVCGLLFVLGATLTGLGIWYMCTFNLEFKELLYTLLSPLKGTGKGTVDEIVGLLVPIASVAAAVYSIFAYLCISPYPARRKWRRIGVLICVLVLVGSLIFSVIAFRIPAYISALWQKTTIYEDYYVDPESVAITADGKTKNLIYIYLESMETTYASADVGGKQSVNYMPHLTALADEHLSFSDKTEGLLGGFHTPEGTTWTIAAMLATTSGIPFAFPVGEDGHNTMSRRENFASGLCTLGDILEEKGYRQEFLCGSWAGFAGRDRYLEQHGNFEIFDLYTAREEGYIPKDYFEWWGYEDHILYDIARDELCELAASDEPFNFTMLTVDTHHVGGYICDECEWKYGERTANVVACADRQLAEFVEWCQAQDFYEDCVIVITGDHARMDKRLIGDTEDYDRTIYNCFLNAAATPEGSTTERVMTGFDLFPTTLAAMGFSIEGDRLGLGVNLFSALPTLAEQIGYETLDAELNKFSDYYIKNFS